MARVDVDFANFTAGELSQRLKGRTDYAKYFDGADTMLNVVTLPQGGGQRRPGTVFVTYPKVNTSRGRPIPFIFSTVQAYMLEFGDGYIRVKKDDAVVVNPQAISGAANNGSGLIRLTLASTAGLYNGNTTTVAGVTGTTEANGTFPITVVDATHIDLPTPFINPYAGGGTATTIVEIPTPYQAADLASLSYTQSADTLYITQGAKSSNRYAPMTLTRSSHTDWSLQPIYFRDGPYQDINTTTTTLTPGATGGGSTSGVNAFIPGVGVINVPPINIPAGSTTTPVTASSTAGINGGQGFLATDVGRLIRIKVTSLWGWGVIAAVNSPTSITVTIQAAFDGTTGTVNWALGCWSETTGFPYIIAFWQQRLMVLGGDENPGRICGSVTADFTNMAPTQPDGTVTDTNALNWIISDDEVNAALWVSPAGSAQTAQLGIGTTGGEQIMQSGSAGQALTPTNVQAYRETTLGSAPNVRPLRIGKQLLFANRPGRVLHEWQFQWTVNGYIGPWLTADAEHVTGSGIAQLAYQQSPYSIVWALLNNGSLIGMTYLPEQKVTAWHRHRLGGDYYGGPTFVEGIAVIPSPDGTYDELWIHAIRTLNGQPTRTIEVMAPFFDGATMDQEDSWFMDCALQSTLNQPNTILRPPLDGSLTNTAEPPDLYAFTGVGVFTTDAATFVPGNQGDYLRINGGSVRIDQVLSAYSVSGTVIVPLSSVGWAGAGSWSLGSELSTFSGLDHLDGETVQILGDGADMGTETVVGGQVTLPAKASLVTAGLPMPYRLVTMPLAPASAAAAQTDGKVKSISHVFLRFFETMGFDFGRQVTDPETDAVEDVTEPFLTRSAGDDMGRPPPIRSGIKRLPLPGGFDQECQILVKGDGPYPFTILSIGAQADIGELPNGG